MVACRKRLEIYRVCSVQIYQKLTGGLQAVLRWSGLRQATDRIGVVGITRAIWSRLVETRKKGASIGSGSESIFAARIWVISLGAALVLPADLNAQTTIWTGGPINNFEAAFDWSGNQKPGVGDTTVFNNSTPVVVMVNSSDTIAGMTGGLGGLSLYVNSNATLTVQGGVTAPAGLLKDGPGTLVIAGGGAIGWFDAGNGVTSQTGGTMQSPELVVGSNLYNSDGSLALPTSGTYQMTGGALVISGTPLGGGTPTLRVGDFGGTGTFSQSGNSTVTVGSATYSGGLNIGNQGGTGTYNLSGGTLTLSTGLSDLGRTSANYPASHGTLNLSGGLLELVGGAELVIGDRDGTGAQGTGTVNQTGGTLRVTNGSLFLSGYGAGTYNLTGGTLAVGGTSLQARYGDNTAAGAMAFNLGGATIQVIGSDLATSASIHLVSGYSSLIDTNGLNATLSGNLTADGTRQIDFGGNALTKMGAGVLTLSGSTRTLDTFAVYGGSVNQTAGDSTAVEFMVGTGTGGNGSFVMGGGTFTVNASVNTTGSPVAGSMRVGDFGGTGTFTQNGGTVTIAANGALNIGNQGGTGTYNLAGGALNLQGSLNVLGRSQPGKPISQGTLNVSGGTLTVQNSSELILGNNFNGAGVALGTGTVNQTGGTVHVAGDSTLYLSGFGNGSYTFTGGTLEVGGTSLAARYSNNTSTYAFNLGGGTIRVFGSALIQAANATLLANTVSTIDTNGLGATWSGAFTGTGGLTKTGAGTLTLNGATASSVGQLLANQGTVTLATTLAASGANFVPTTPNTNAATHRNAVVVQGGAALNLASGANLAVANNDNNTAFLRVGYADTAGGTLNIASGSTLQVGQSARYANFIVGEGLGASGAVNQTGGTVTAKGSFNLGEDGGTGTYTISSGTLTIDHADDAGHTSLATIGMNLNAAGLNAGTSTGALVITGGTVDVTAHVWDPTGHPGIYGQTELILGSRAVGGGAGNGSITQTGGVLQVDNPATLYLSSVGNGTYNLNGGTLKIGGSSLQTNYGNGPGTYAFNYGAGTIQVIGSSLSTSANFTLQPTNGGAASILDTNGYDATLSGNITTTGTGQTGAGGNGFFKIGAGTLNLTGGNRAFNTFGVMGGTVAQGAGTTAATEFMVGSGAGNSGAFVLNGGSITINPTLDAHGNLVTFGSLRTGDYGGTGTFTQNGGTVTASNGAAFHIGNQGGTGTYNLNGGTLTLVGDDNVLGRSTGTNPGSSGTLNVAGGTLQLQGAGALILGNNTSGTGVALGTGTVNQTAGTVTVANDSYLYLSGFGGGAYNLNGGTLAIGANSLQAHYGTSTSSYAFNFGGGTLKVIGSALTTSVATTLLPGTNSTIDTNGLSATFNGIISGSGNLTKQGLGTLLLGGNNTYSGTTFVTAGTLQLGAAGALSPNTTLQVSPGAIFDTNGFAPVIGGLSGTGQLNLNNGSLAVQPTGTNSFAGQLTGNGGLTMAGPGTLELDNVNTYAGPTAVTQGTVRLGADGALPSGTSLQISSGATLDLNSHAVTVGQLAGSGNVALGHASLAINQSGNSTFSGAISGTGGLAKSGGGVLTFTGTGTFTGATTVTGGGLKINGSIAQSPVTVTNSGVLSGAGTVGNLTIGGGGVLSPGNSPGTLTVNGNATFGGGGNTIWQINQATSGTAGGNPGWDLVNITGTLTITATSVSPFVFKLQSLNLAGDAAGSATGFNPGQSYSFLTAATTGGISGFSASAFTIDTSGFQNSFTGTWSLEQIGNNLDVVYTVSAVPEPSTYAALLGAAALGAAFLFRRRVPRPV
jgi:autotransporter-associated beta strand protein